MSLLKRVERAQQLAAQAAEQATGERSDAGPPSAVATVPMVSEPVEPAAVMPAPVAAVPPPVLTPTSQVTTVLPGGSPPASGLGRGLAGAGLGAVAVPVRSDLIRNLRFHLQDEVIGTIGSLLDLTPDEVRGPDRGHRRPDRRRHGFAVTRDERQRLVDEMVHEITGLGPARAAPRRRVDHRGHGQRPAPRLHRARRQDPARRRPLPQRRARPPHHRPDHHPARPAHRRVQPPGRCPPARRLAGQRRGRAAVAHRPGHHRPQVLGPAVHRRRPHQLRHRRRPRCSSSCRPASRPASTSSSRAARARARPRP